MRRVISFLSILVLTACTVDDNPQPETQDYTADADFNSAVDSFIGNIFYAEEYPTNGMQVPIVNITVGNDSVVYFGMTDAQGRPHMLSGFTFQESTTGMEYRFKVDRQNQKIIIDQNDQSGLFLEVGTINDTLFAIKGFKVEEDQSKKILFEFVKESSHLSNGRVLEADNNLDEMVNQGLRDVYRIATTTTHDYGFLNALVELDIWMKRQDVNFPDKDKVSTMVQGARKGGVTLTGNFIDKLSSFRKSVKSGLISALQFPLDLYNAYEILDRYSIEKEAGDQQMVKYGGQILPLRAQLNYAGEPAYHQSVDVEIKVGSRTHTVKLLSDSQGIVEFALLPLGIEHEESGVNKITVKMMKAGWANRSTEFVIHFIKRPRLSIIKDQATDQQQGGEYNYLTKPLRVVVVDEDITRINDIDIAWSSTGGSLDYYASTTDELGEARNNWKLGSAGMSYAQAHIVESLDYVIVSGTADFTATAIDSMDLYTQSIIGTYNIKIYAEDGDHLDSDTGATIVHFREDGQSQYQVYGSQSWADGTSFWASWEIVRHNGRYYFSEFGFWHPGFGDYTPEHPLTYPVTQFRYHNNSIYQKQ